MLKMPVPEPLQIGNTHLNTPEGNKMASVFTVVVLIMSSYSTL